MSTTNIATSMSQMSISHLQKRHRKHLLPAIDTIENKNNADDKPKYLKVPDQIFKQMLLRSSAEATSIADLLDTSEKLQYIRTYVHLLNNICYLKFEDDFWTHYHTVATTEGIWSSPLEKELIKNNNVYRISFKTKAQVERHHQSILSRLKKAENELAEHRQQQQQLSFTNDSFDINKLSAVLLAFVRQQQRNLNRDFERRKSLVQFDANDHRFIKAFYDLKPLQNQVRTVCSCKEIFYRSINPLE